MSHLPRAARRESRPSASQTHARVLELIRSLAARLKRSPTRAEFVAATGRTIYSVEKPFECWSNALQAAGLAPPAHGYRIPDEILLTDWGNAFRAHGRIPKYLAYFRLGKWKPSTLARRFGGWARIPAAFRSFAAGNPQWRDVLAKLPTTRLKPRHQPHHSFTKFGAPLNFPGFPHEPTEEIGVVFLFALLCRDLKFSVENVQCRFPDCIAKRQIAPGVWQQVKIEFEFESRNFLTHGHPVSGCDLIVCWRHNWPACPLEVLELSSVIKALPASKSL